MPNLHQFQPGRFSFLEGGFPYSAGVIALPGSRLTRARFAKSPNMKDGFEQIAAHLKSVGQPLTSLCAVELRSPKPFSFSGFHEFNVGYVKVLGDWGLVRNGLNPVARSNVCPLFDAPSEPVFHAFSYTEVSSDAQSAAASKDLDFVVAGSGEWPEGQPFPDAIVARADLSPAGLAAKVSFVINTMKERCAGLGGNWARLTAAQVYTVENFHGLLKSHFQPAGLTALGLSWSICKPPIIELEFEMDVRSLTRELVL